ncbi:hypothetical protein GGI42DRAFT_147613 [Trichoderma sp. SZMC 28013]
MWESFLKVVQYEYSTVRTCGFYCYRYQAVLGNLLMLAGAYREIYGTFTSSKGLGTYLSLVLYFYCTCAACSLEYTGRCCNAEAGGRNRWDSLETCLRWGTQHGVLVRLQRMDRGYSAPFFSVCFWACYSTGARLSHRAAEASAVLEKVPPQPLLIRNLWLLAWGNNIAASRNGAVFARVLLFSGKEKDNLADQQEHTGWLTCNTETSRVLKLRSVQVRTPS